jgi:branched-chain amino acid transport system ATP-binding protein
VALEVRDLTIVFGGVIALDRVGFTVSPGSLCGLIGPNGAGKTTCIEAISGFIPVKAGSISLDGKPLDRLRPDERARRGVVRTFQAGELFDDLTVRENLLAASYGRSWRESALDLIAPNRSRPPAVVEETLDLMGIAEVAQQYPPDLALGERKLVSVARALVMQPRVVLLDEPAAGLEGADAQELGTHLRTVVDSGITVVLVDHDMDLVLGVCDKVVVLDFGKVLADGSPEAIRSDERVIAAYLGDEAIDPGGVKAADGTTR